MTAKIRKAKKRSRKQETSQLTVRASTQRGIPYKITEFTFG